MRVRHSILWGQDIKLVSLFIQYGKSSDQQWSIDSRGQNRWDEYFIEWKASRDHIDNQCILDQMKKGRKLPAYGIVAHVMLAITIVLSLQVDKNSQVFSSPPAGELEVLRWRPPPYHCHPVDRLRTSSTDTADRRPDSGCQCSVRALGLMLSDLVVSPSRTRPRGPGSAMPQHRAIWIVRHGQSPGFNTDFACRPTPGRPPAAARRRRRLLCSRRRHGATDWAWVVRLWLSGCPHQCAGSASTWTAVTSDSQAALAAVQALPSTWTAVTVTVTGLRPGLLRESVTSLVERERDAGCVPWSAHKSASIQWSKYSDSIQWPASELPNSARARVVPARAHVPRVHVYCCGRAWQLEPCQWMCTSWYHDVHVCACICWYRVSICTYLLVSCQYVHVCIAWAITRHLHQKCLSMKCRYVHVSACICWYSVSICIYLLKQKSRLLL